MYYIKGDCYMLISVNQSLVIQQGTFLVFLIFVKNMEVKKGCKEK